LYTLTAIVVSSRISRHVTCTVGLLAGYITSWSSIKQFLLTEELKLLHSPK